MPDETPSIAVALAHAATIRFPSAPHAAKPGTKERARAAVERAIHLSKLREEYAGTGFLAMPLDQYLARLARMAGVPLSVASPGSTNPSPLAALKPLLAMANALEMAASHVRLWVRSWFAALDGPVPTGFVAARSTGSTAATHAVELRKDLTPEAADSALKEIEHTYAPARRRELEAALSLIE